MKPEQLRNLGLYALWAFIGAVVATGLHLAQLLSGTDTIAIRGLAATFTTSFFGSLATVAGASQLTRLGSEQLAAQVNYLKAQGVPRSEMVVLSQDEAVPVLAGGLTPTAVQQVGDAVERRMPTATEIAEEMLRLRGEQLQARLAERRAADPGLLSQPPRFLDDAEHPAREERG